MKNGLRIIITANLIIFGICQNLRYIAFPFENARFVELPEKQNMIPLLRIPRRAVTTVNNYARHRPSSSRLRMVGSNNHDMMSYADYGAHTGHNGAFGWYADFPAFKRINK